MYTHLIGAMVLNVTISSVVDSPLFVYPRGAVAIHRADAYVYEPTATQLFPQRPEMHALITQYYKRNAWALPDYVKRTIIRTRI